MRLVSIVRNLWRYGLSGKKVRYHNRNDLRLTDYFDILREEMKKPVEESERRKKFKFKGLYEIGFVYPILYYSSNYYF